MLLFKISTETAIESGIVSRAELPELLFFFKSAARGRSAKVFHLACGLLIAERDEHFVTLSVTYTDLIIPSRNVFESIEDAMANTFNNRESDAHRLPEEKGQPKWPYFD